MLSESSPAGVEHRRRWPINEKRRIVELTMEPGKSLTSVSEEFRLHSTTISHLKKLYRTGNLNESRKRRRRQKRTVEFLPVTIDAKAPASVAIVVQLTIANGYSVRIECDAVNVDATKVIRRGSDRAMVRNLTTVHRSIICAFALP